MYLTQAQACNFTHSMTPVTPEKLAASQARRQSTEDMITRAQRAFESLLKRPDMGPPATSQQTAVTKAAQSWPQTQDGSCYVEDKGNQQSSTVTAFTGANPMPSLTTHPLSEDILDAEKLRGMSGLSDGGIDSFVLWASLGLAGAAFWLAKEWSKAR